MDNTAPSSGQRSMQQPSKTSLADSGSVSQPIMDPQVSPVAANMPADNKSNSETKQEEQQISASNMEFGPIASVSPSEMGAQPEEADDEDEIKVARQEVLISTKVAPVQEVEVSPELKELGVEQGADTEKEIPVVVQRAGMRAAKTDSAVPLSAVGTIKLPITHAHAVQLDKTSKIKESIKWLARFIKRQWEKVKYMETQKDQTL